MRQITYCRFLATTTALLQVWRGVWSWRDVDASKINNLRQVKVVRQMNNTTQHYTKWPHYYELQYDILHHTTITSLNFTISNCTTLHFTTLSCTSMNCTRLHYTTQHYSALHYNKLHHTTLHYTANHSDTLQHTTLHGQITLTTILRWKRLEGDMQCD